MLYDLRELWQADGGGAARDAKRPSAARGRRGGRRCLWRACRRSCADRAASVISRLKRSANSNAFDYTVTSCQWRIGCRWHNSIPLRNTHSPRLAGVLPWVASLHHCDGMASNMSRLVPPTPRLKAAPDVGLEHPCLDHTTLPAQTRPVDAVEAWRHLVTACQFDQQPLEGHLRLVMSKVVVHFL